MALFPEDMVIQAEIFDFTLTLTQVDNLSRVGIRVSSGALISVIYQLHEKDKIQDVSGLMYAGAAICAVFARDLISLFILGIDRNHQRVLDLCATH